MIDLSHLSLKNRSGIVLVMILGVSILLTIMTIGIINSNANQIISGRRQIDRVKAEQYAKGIMWINGTQLGKGGAAFAPATTSLNGKTFTPALTSNGTLPSNANIQRYDISITY